MRYRPYFKIIAALVLTSATAMPAIALVRTASNAGSEELVAIDMRTRTQVEALRAVLDQMLACNTKGALFSAASASPDKCDPVQAGINPQN